MRQGVQVVWVPDLKCGHLEFQVPLSLPVGFTVGSSSCNSSAVLADSQLHCLLPVGILYLLSLIIIIAGLFVCTEKSISGVVSWINTLSFRSTNLFPEALEMIGHTLWQKSCLIWEATLVQLELHRIGLFSASQPFPSIGLGLDRLGCFQTRLWWHHLLMGHTQHTYGLWSSQYQPHSQKYRPNDSQTHTEKRMSCQFTSYRNKRYVVAGCPWLAKRETSFCTRRVVSGSVICQASVHSSSQQHTLQPTPCICFKLNQRFKFNICNEKFRKKKYTSKTVVPYAWAWHTEDTLPVYVPLPLVALCSQMCTAKTRYLHCPLALAHIVSTV